MFAVPAVFLWFLIFMATFACSRKENLSPDSQANCKEIKSVCLLSVISLVLLSIGSASRHTFLSIFPGNQACAWQEPHWSDWQYNLLYSEVNPIELNGACSQVHSHRIAAWVPEGLAFHLIFIMKKNNCLRAETVFFYKKKIVIKDNQIRSYQNISERMKVRHCCDFNTLS